MASKPKYSKAHCDAARMQRLLMRDIEDDKTIPPDRAKSVTAWLSLQRLKHDIEMRPRPQAVKVEAPRTGNSRRNRGLAPAPETVTAPIQAQRGPAAPGSFSFEEPTAAEIALSQRSRHESKKLAAGQNQVDSPPTEQPEPGQSHVQPVEELEQPPDA
jgi:hypothetical protein